MNNLLNTNLFTNILLNIAIVLGIGSYIYQSNNVEINQKWDSIEAPSLIAPAHAEPVQVSTPSAPTTKVETPFYNTAYSNKEAVEKLMNEATIAKTRKFFDEIDY